ncbi:MAG: hypothetical protein HY316_02320 [Acidobacteria bacterium]|nr:hypothetical protein [Acidobacteriota bacterium]
MPDASLREIIERARTAQGPQLENLLYHRSREVLEALLENPRLGEQHLMILVARKDLSREVVAVIAQNQEWMKSYPLKAAILRHPRTPRHLALRLLKFIYPFDLLEIAATPGIAPDLKRLLEDTLLSQREGMATGQRLSLARRGTTRLAGGLLNDPDARVVRAALDNPALTEQSVASALMAGKTAAELTAAASEHPRWSSRRGVKLALLRSGHLSLARFAAILPQLPLGDLNDLAEDPRVAPNLRSYVAKMVEMRKTRSKKKGV